VTPAELFDLGEHSAREAVAVARIQAKYRSRLARKFSGFLRECRAQEDAEVRGALRLQARWRGRHARRELTARKAARAGEAERARAATELQKTCRAAPCGV